MQENDIDRRSLSFDCLNLLGMKYKKLSPDEVQCSCPFHEEKHPSFFVNLKKGVYHCFSCGRSGSMEQLFREKTGQSLWKVLGIGTISDPMQKYAFQTTQRQVVPPPAESLKLKTVYLNFDKSQFIPALENEGCAQYLHARGVFPEVVKQMQMCYCESTRINNTLFQRRLVIPVMENNSLVSIEGRRIYPEDPEPKVLYPKSTTVNTLYDIDHLNKDSRLYACEGLFDLAVLRSHNSSDPDIFKNSTSIFGANLTNRQLGLLKQFREVVYIPDNDEPGQRPLEKMKEAGLTNVSVLRLPKEINGVQIKDIGDLPKAGICSHDLVERKWLKYIKPL